MPIFGNMRLNFLDRRASPFLDVKGGYSPVDGKGGYVAVSVGVNYQFTPKLGINFSFGYMMQQAEFSNYYSYYYYGYHSYYVTNKELMHHLGFKLGLEF